MKIALTQPNFHVGNFESNFDLIQEMIEEAESNNSDLIIFPELALTGYPPRDFLEFDTFIDQVEEYLEKIKDLSNNIGIIIGAPRKNPSPKGKRLYNSCFFFHKNETIAIQDKTLLPTYDIFDEVRYFESNSSFNTVEFKGQKIALTICEDLWNVGENPLYQSEPLEQFQNFDLVINIAASPFDFSHLEERINIIQANAKKYNTPIFYTNHVGAQTELLFDGTSMHIDKNGEIISIGDQFKEGILYSQLSDKAIEYSVPNKYDQIESALVLGIKDYFKKLNFKKAVIGLSGGIDSALTFALSCKAIGSENVHGILMPSQYSSDHSVADAEQLVKNLNASCETIEIKDLFFQFENSLKDTFKGTEYDLTEENLQARIRGTLLMAYSNKFGNIVLNTSNKSEAAVGYGTLYGDMCGGLSVLGDLYKTEVFELSKWINREQEIIPNNTITKPPSAELRPDQKDSDSLPEYDILDPILKLYIENRKGTQEIINMGFDEALVKRIIRLVNINEYKRYQTAPTLRVSSKAFGMGRRLPIAAKFSN